ncbi:putative alpha/beta hydrolase [Hypoxylon cercidicola]|nr:putative alpha/beta hydrolase [Hypoxylon cercidicola]
MPSQPGDIIISFGSLNQSPNQDNMAATQTIQVPHLDAQVGYAISNGKIDPSKPTTVLINGMCVNVGMYRDQMASDRLTAATNLLAIEPLGHGSTTCASEHFTYWDTALVALQAMEALGVSKAFALGTSHGGWIVTRMALLAPERIQGLIPLGTSMDMESTESRLKGCWDPAPFVTPFIQKWSIPAPDFVVGDDWIGTLVSLGLGSAATPGVTKFWTEQLRRTYSGDEGRKKIRMATICLTERDGLLYRLGDIKCPVHWLQGTNDAIYSTVIAKEQIEMFTGSRDAKIDIVEGGAHFLSATNPKEVEEAILGMVANVE